MKQIASNTKKQIASSATALWMALTPLSETPELAGVRYVGGIAVRMLDQGVRLYGYARVAKAILEEMEPGAKERKLSLAPPG